jgi:hypothetical protein
MRYTFGTPRQCVTLHICHTSSVRCVTHSSHLVSALRHTFVTPCEGFLLWGAGIPLRETEFVQDYWHNVFEQFLADCAKGLTPNPDLACNRHIKVEPGRPQSEMKPNTNPKRKRPSETKANTNHKRKRTSETKPKRKQASEMKANVNPK